MAFDLPTSPSNGQIYTYNGRSWTYDSTQTAWIQSAYASTQGLVFLETGTMNTTSSNKDIDISSYTSDYDVLEFVLSAVAVDTDGADLRIQFSDDGGSTFEADAGDYNYCSAFYHDNSNTVSGSVRSGSATIIQLDDNLGSGANEHDSGFVRVLNAGATEPTGVQSSLLRVKDSVVLNWQAAGYMEAAVAVTDVRFSMSAGDIDGGNYRLYGYRKS